MRKSPENITVRTTLEDLTRMDRLVPKLERRNRGAKFKRPGVITKALDALERELSAADQAKARAQEVPAH